jgi:hypothetical protein
MATIIQNSKRKEVFEMDGSDPKRAPGHRRGFQRANRSLGAVERISKRIYQTKSKLEKLLPRLIRRDRQQWFAARVRELRSWPEVDKEKALEAASRIQPRRLMDGRWAWPKRELEIQRELLASAPHDRIDVVALREVLAGLDDRQADRLIEMLAERVDLEAIPTLVEGGLPAPKEIGTPLLRRLKRLHNKLLDALAGDPAGDLAKARRLEVPRANLKSHSGWLSETRGFLKIHGRWRSE